MDHIYKKKVFIDNILEILLLFYILSIYIRVFIGIIYLPDPDPDPRPLIYRTLNIPDPINTETYRKSGPYKN